MKRLSTFFLVCAMLCMSLSGCAQNTEQPLPQSSVNVSEIDGTQIILSDDGITVDGNAISASETDSVYAANDIVYYEEGKDFTYGEGDPSDAHSAAEADAHTVVHITKPGTYVLNGKLSQGQVAVDLGKDAKEDPDAVVTLILNGIDIFCSVAPAVIFYNVYECGSSDEETASMTVDTSAAGANVLIADGTVNNITGSYVARIYKPESVVLNEAGTEVTEAKKLHKYDAAFYSKKSMNVDAWGEGTGVLNIFAENEGLDSELHLTINGGNINITSGNDGINTNEDYVSVTTVNGGNLNIVVNGSTGEGDGIDSNGWLVINGGSVSAFACGFSADAGIDSDMGIHVNGGTVVASGNMLDRLEDGGQTYAVFTFAQTQKGGSTYTMKNAAGEIVAECMPVNDFSILVISAPEMTAGEYTFWQGDTQLAASAGSSGGMMGGMRPGGMMGGMQFPGGMEFSGDMQFDRPGNMQMPDGMRFPENMEIPEGMQPPQGERGDSFAKWDGPMTIPEGAEMDPAQMQRPNGDRGGWQGSSSAEVSPVFTIVDGANYFSAVTAAK